ncbi:MAG: putative metalloprotease CJM1_0395 family protein [Myxococcota bacterium]
MDPIVTQALEPLQPLLSAQQRSGPPPGPPSSSAEEDGVTISFSPEALDAAAALPPVEPLADTAGLTGEADAEDPDAIAAEQEEAELQEALQEALLEEAIDAADEAPLAGPKSDDELSDEEKQVVAKLQARDREVRAHEQAHMSAGGGMAGAASYTYQTGPDGKRYAIGGEVPISVPASTNPQQALMNAQQLRAAALAPASPSGQDRAVAAQAANMIAEAQSRIAQTQQSKLEETMGSGKNSGEGAADSLRQEPETSGYDERISPANMGGAFWRNWANS